MIATTKLNENDIKREVLAFKDDYPKLSDDNLFVIWFLRAFVVDNPDDAVKSLTGGSGDKGIDAIYIDDKSQCVWIVQAKYRDKINGHFEKRADVMEFSQLVHNVYANEQDYSSFTAKMPAQVKRAIDDARERLIKRNYSLKMLYVTLGKFSSEIEKEAKCNVRKNRNIKVTIEFFGGTKILLLLEDYLEGVAPPVPSIELRMESGDGIKVTGILNRFDVKNEIESWVFPVKGDSIAEVYGEWGAKLFARNVRGFLGDTNINRRMEKTLASEPEFFWYFNNGITIVCDHAEKRSCKGQDTLYIENPQIINGQQTTRTISGASKNTNRASIIIRVIRVPRSSATEKRKFDNIISNIVGATNYQNAIKLSDLMSNDKHQINIQREFRKLNYLYLRKRQSKSEAKAIVGASSKYHIISKEELAQAVAACDIDPYIVRLGKDTLFSEKYYGSIFSHSDPLYFLNRYWAMKIVTKAAKGHPEWAYAKWVTLNYLWSQIDVLLKPPSIAKKFHADCLKKSNTTCESLEKLAVLIYKEVLSYYRNNCGHGETKTDVSSFFKARRINADFLAFMKTKVKILTEIENTVEEFKVSL